MPVLRGLTLGCQFLDPMENVLITARQILVDSSRVFAYGNQIVMEVGEDCQRRLIRLMAACHLEQAAPALLANLLVCESRAGDDERDPPQFAPPWVFVELLLNSEPTRALLPQIRTYSTRPLFDSNYRLLGPGWHPEVGILIHGPQIEPIVDSDTPTGGPARRPLPPHLQHLLGDFCFRSDADLINTVGMMLTGLLAPQFVTAGKGLALLDGNRPGVGKTLLGRTIGVVLDGEDPDLIHYTPDDEELAKRICATLHGRRQSVLIFDNAKVRAGASITSRVIEAYSMAPEISLRILGHSANLTRPNDLLWLITMNDTKVCTDMVSRNVPIRLCCGTDPESRDFAGRNPVQYAMEHRVEILGELAGMIVRWNQAGRPCFRRHRHRCAEWASTIGGILEASGLPDFLENLREAAAQFNTAADDLAALAEAAVRRNRGAYTEVSQAG